MRFRPVVATFTAVFALGLAASPAHALQFGKSSTTGESVVLVPLRTGGTLAGPVDYAVGLRWAPGLSAILGPASLPAGRAEASSMLFDADFWLGYRYTLADVQFLGRFNPSITPFLGYRWLGAFTAERPTGVTNLSASLDLAQLHGLQYGVSADTEIPLGFRAYARAGLTTLLGGGWDTRENGIAVTRTGSIDPGKATLPSFGLGVSWSGLGLINLSLGYDVFALPTDMRTQTSVLGAGRSIVNNLTVGIALPGISF